ncbi:MAG: PfkB family carbohydrate kinase [Parvibaculum sp.]|nr:PfkB family carbohydrate kinase [Parvibaculum sp.]
MQSANDQGHSIEAIRKLAGPDRRIAFVSGNFNVVHPGHLRILKFAKENADFLVVGVTPDSTAGVSLPATLRLEGLLAISIVDYTFLLSEPPEEFIARLKPEVVVKGKEYEARVNSEQSTVESYNGKLLFSSGEMRFASFNLLQKEYYEADLSMIRKPLDFPKRRGFLVPDLKAILPKLAGLRVLVIGDLIVDTYLNCEPLGMSQEDPTIVVTPIDEKSFIGGAGIVAAHAAGLGGNVHFITVAGKDEWMEFAESALQNSHVSFDILLDSTRPTTHKKRFRANGKTLLRVNNLRQHAINSELTEEMLNAVRLRLKQTDLILFSDFNYGCLPQPLVDAVIDMAREHEIMMAADSQASSQISDISRFKGMELVTPTEREARLALRDQESGLVILGERLQLAASAHNVIITLGSEGLLIHGNHEGNFVTDRLPAFNSSPKDVAGAGDSLFTCTAMARCVGVDIWQSVYLGALAAGCQVSRVGNTPLSLEELITEIEDPASYSTN